MGAGKSTVGAALAGQLDYRFIDLDDEIERHDGRTIAEMFAASGEAYFRKVEANIGCKLLGNRRIVIALGGGAVTSSRIMAALKETACLIYLRADPDTLWERIKDNPDRPLAAGLTTHQEFLNMYRDRMKVRRPLYEQADIIVDTGTAPLADTAAAIFKQLQGNV